MYSNNFLVFFVNNLIVYITANIVITQRMGKKIDWAYLRKNLHLF